MLQNSMQRYPLITALLLGACSAPSGDLCAGQADPVSMEASTAAGSAESLLDLVQGQEEQVLSGIGFGTVDMTLAVEWSGESAAWRDQESIDTENTYACADSLRVPVEVSLVTANRQLDETWTVELSATEPGMATLQQEVLIDELRGTWRPDVSDLQDLRLRVLIEWTETGSEGVLTAVGTPTDGGADHTWVVAVWPG